jgi:hypothetical protein
MTQDDDQRRSAHIHLDNSRLAAGTEAAEKEGQLKCNSETCAKCSTHPA